jgi:tRNA threonylcarbamoyladenosine biosynthesis protein TsaE
MVYKTMQILSRSEVETGDVARNLAEKLQPGDVLFLNGNLGAGKSVFARALIRSLCGEPDLEVPSPTFTLVQIYDTEKGPLWHFDLYRIKAPEEIYELGWDDARAEGIVLVEWPLRLGAGLAPQDRLEIGFDQSSDHKEMRLIKLNGHGQWKQRLEKWP